MKRRQRFVQSAPVHAPREIPQLPIGSDSARSAETALRPVQEMPHLRAMRPKLSSLFAAGHGRDIGPPEVQSEPFFANLAALYNKACRCELNRALAPAA